MRKRTKWLAWILVVLLSLTMLSACSPAAEEPAAPEGPAGEEPAAPEEPVEKIPLRIVSAWDRGAAEHLGFWIFMDEVEKQLGDRLEITYLGGPEVVPYFDQYEMLGKGTFEIGHLPGNMATNFLPIAETLHLSFIKPWEERENGVYDTLREQFEEKMNLVYLGKTAGDGYLYSLYTNFEVKSLADFNGKTFRTSPVYVPLLDALGAGSVSMPVGEVYTAMERGVVDGFGWPTLGPMDYGWYEVTKYRISPGFYPTGIGIFFNKDAFYDLPEDIQRSLEDIAAQAERTAYDEIGKVVIEELKAQEEAGLIPIELSPEDRETYLNLAYDEGWKAIIEADPVYAPEIKDLTAPK